MCVTATRGEAGFPADDPRSEAERSAVRESELAACLAILGVTEHRYLGYGDGKCADVPDDEPVAALVEIINEMRPDTVLSFAPDGATAHPDHIATCRWATQGGRGVGPPGARLLYAAKTPRWTEQYFSGVDPSTIYMFPDFRPENFDESEVDVWFTCDDALVDRKLAAMLAQKSQIEGLAHDIGLEVFREVLREEFFRAPRVTDVDSDGADESPPAAVTRSRPLGPFDSVLTPPPHGSTALTTPSTTQSSIDVLVRRAVGLMESGRRAILGIAGPPGAGKSTLVADLIAALPASSPESAGEAWWAHVPMDGFHLADAQLERLGLRDRKGAPETFDDAGYAACLQRIHDSEGDVYVPGFERKLEQPIAAALMVPSTARFVITEGNYLLLTSGSWPRARETMAEVWYCDVDDGVRRERLIARHVEFGKSLAAATEWVDRSDEVNARLVSATKARADLVVTHR